MNRLVPCGKACLDRVIGIIRDVITYNTIFIAYFIRNIIWFFIGREKSFENDVVLITGSGGYLGTSSSSIYKIQFSKFEREL